MINKIRERSRERYAMMAHHNPGLSAGYCWAGWLAGSQLNMCSPAVGAVAAQLTPTITLQSYNVTTILLHFITGQIFQQEIILSPDHRYILC